MTASQEIIGVFDRSADTYDAVGVPWFGPIAEGLVAELAPELGDRVLDLGCGRGAATLPLTEAVGPTGLVLALDASPRMVEAAARDFAHLPQVSVRVGDASAPELPGASYEVVAASLVLFFLPDPVAALRAWADLLVPGGRVGVSTFGPQEPQWKAVDDHFTPYLPQDMKDARVSGRKGPFASDAGVEQLLRDAGLSHVRTATTTLTVTFDDAEQWHAFSWSHGQRALWEAVPESERPAVKQRCLASLAACHDASGRPVVTQQVRYTVGRKS